MATKRKSGAQSPAMQQFFRAKEQYPDALLFFRMGDFYELFFEDAVIGARALDLALTSRSKSSENGEPIPMAGVPHHAAAGYLARLIEKGFKVAICEQMADPKTVKGIVPREVVRVVTPGLALDPDALDARVDNALVALTLGVGDEIGIAALELSRLEIRATTVPDSAALLAELVRLDAREVLHCGMPEWGEAIRRALPRARVAPIEPTSSARLPTYLSEEQCAKLERSASDAALTSCATVLQYARTAQPKTELRIRSVEAYDPSAYLVLDEGAVRNLELVRTLSGDRAGSLLANLDCTSTSMGARLLRRRLLAPLGDLSTIRRRHDAVEAFVLDPSLRTELRELLSSIGDLERLSTRTELGIASPRDIGGIRDALRAAGRIKTLLADVPESLTPLVPDDVAEDIEGLIETALVEELPLVTSAGGFVRDRVQAQIDELRTLSSSSKEILLGIEAKERESSGIGSLKIRFTKVFGYYIEITRANLHLVPSHFRRKQTVANGERFTTEELEELQSKILTADERLKSLELEVFEDIRTRVGEAGGRLRALALALADLDVHAALAELAHRRGFVRPDVDDSTSIDVDECRHPVVETLLPAGTFVPNDLSVDADGQRFILITGPNMAGKSTTMRALALVVIMAQAGSFVAATRARIGLVDRVFTRVGASDDLSRGQSTFMVEMRETATILNEATPRSLVILDEIGRGTSTYDGLSIAWSVAEYLHDQIGCRALFATHYHELCELERTRAGVRNFNVAATEHAGDVVFLHRLVPGAANRSYGVAVAKIAGVPEVVLERAKSLLRSLEGAGQLPSGAHSTLRARIEAESPQLGLGLEVGAAAETAAGGAVTPGSTGGADSGGSESAIEPIERRVAQALRELDLDQMTPLGAMNALADLRAKLADG